MIRTKTLALDEWEEFVLFGQVNNQGDEDRADQYLFVSVLLPYYKRAELALERLKVIGDDMIAPGIRNVLLRRWDQIRRLIRSAFQNGLSQNTRLQHYKALDASAPEPEEQDV